MKGKPKYSVIIPLYNKAPYVKKAIESVCAQTYRNFECIVVDDGSTDGSLDIVRSLDTGDCTLEIISQSNSGVAVARNNGVKASHGEYVAFLDADDWWEPTWLEEMDKLIREYPEAGLYATNYVYYKPGKTHVALKLERGFMNYPDAYLHGEMPVTSISTCMPRRVFDEMGGFPIGIKLGEDFLLWAKTAIKYKVAFCEKPLAYYNNDIPASMRATRNLHTPEHHMLFNLQSIEDDINRLQSTSNQSTWMQLIDNLRISGLMNYWLSAQYHDDAARELEKVNWSQQPKSVVRLYKTPIWLLKAKRFVMRVGSYWKQKLIKIKRSV